MQPHIFRAAFRNFLNMEPFPGVFASLVQESGCCPSCGASLHTEGLDLWAVTQHLSSCKAGGGMQRASNNITATIAECYKDVGVRGNTETPGLSEISAHRPGDFVSERISTPVEFNCGGSERHVVDSVIAHTGAYESLHASQRGPQKKLVDTVECRKVAKLKTQVANGERSPLPPGYRFVPVGISSRGVMGTQCEKLLEWLADYGAKNRGMLTYMGESGTAVKAHLLQRWAQRMSVAINRGTIEELWFRVVEIRRKGRVGDDALTGVDIRFGGVSGVG